MGWVRVKIQFGIIGAVDLRLRGSRKKIQENGFGGWCRNFMDEGIDGNT